MAHVRRARAQICGVIAVPADIRDVQGLSLADLNAAFEITAKRVERVSPPGGFAFDKLIPMQVGQAHRVRRGTSTTARSPRHSGSSPTDG